MEVSARASSCLPPYTPQEARDQASKKGCEHSKRGQNMNENMIMFQDSVVYHHNRTPSAVNECPNIIYLETGRIPKSASKAVARLAMTMARCTEHKANASKVNARMCTTPHDPALEHV